jgi:hypothetical protein
MMGRTGRVIIKMSILYKQQKAPSAFMHRVTAENNGRVSLEPANENVIIHIAAYTELGIIARELKQNIG